MNKSAIKYKIFSSNSFLDEFTSVIASLRRLHRNDWLAVKQYSAWRA